MKKLTVPVLDEKDRNFVDSLVSIGLKRNVAKTLVYLSGVGETVSREIELGADLRQPEVSIVMRELKEEGWLEVQEIKKEGKGRPLKSYHLSKPLSDIIGILEERKMSEAEENLENIRKLRSYSDIK